MLRVVSDVSVSADNLAVPSNDDNSGEVAKVACLESAICDGSPLVGNDAK